MVIRSVSALPVTHLLRVASRRPRQLPAHPSLGSLALRPTLPVFAHGEQHPQFGVDAVRFAASPLQARLTARTFVSKDSSTSSTGIPEREDDVSLRLDPTTSSRPNSSNEVSQSPASHEKDFISLGKSSRPATEIPDIASSVSTTNGNDSLPSSLPSLPRWLEDILEVWKAKSGTAEVLVLKEAVSTKAEAFDTASASALQARRHLDESLMLWERVNGQHMQLLQRRDRWTSEDAREFASLVEKEVHNRTTMENARSKLTEAENILNQTQLEYMNAMRKRYHEEQIWQDQWRILSTFGTWSLIVLNSLIFLSSQFFHYRREASKMKHLETLIKENVASQEAFKDEIVSSRRASIPTSTPASGISTEESDSGNTVSIAEDYDDQSEAGQHPPSAVKTTKSLRTVEDGDETEGEISLEVTMSQSEGDLHEVYVPTWAQNILHHSLIRPLVSSDVVQKTVRTTQDVAAASVKQTRSVVQSTRDNIKRFTDEVHPPSVVLGASIVMFATLMLASPR